MMKLVKYLLILFLVVIVLAFSPMIIDERGYVLISWNNTVLEGSLMSFSIMAVVGVLAAVIVFYILRCLFKLYANTRLGFSFRSENKKLVNLQQGIWANLTGDHATSYKLLAKSNVPDGWQGISKAIAAKSAMAQGDKSKALDLLSELDGSDKIYAAELFVESGESEIAKEMLLPVAADKKRTPLELRLYSQLLLQEKEWDKLTELLPKLDKKQLLSENEWQVLFQQYFNDIGSDDIKSKFKALNRSLQKKAESMYIQAMLTTKNAPEVIPQLIKMLKKEQFEQLLKILIVPVNYVCLELKKAVQNALKKQPEQQDLLLCLAYIAKAEQDHDLAAKIFKSVLNQYNEPAHWQAAAYSYAQQGDTKQALSLYQQYTPGN